MFGKCELQVLILIIVAFFLVASTVILFNLSWYELFVVCIYVDSKTSLDAPCVVYQLAICICQLDDEAAGSCSAPGQQPVASHCCIVLDAACVRPVNCDHLC